MALALLLILLALLVGGVALAIKGSMWLLIIAAVMLVLGAVMGMDERRRARI